MTTDGGEAARDLKDDIFKSAAFGIEHALGMHAFSFCTIPAEGIYDSGALSPLANVLEKCHIYLIGYTPRVNFIGAEQRERSLLLKFEILKREYVTSFQLPEGLSLQQRGELCYLEDLAGKRFWPSEIEMQTKLSREFKAIRFEVKYIGQAYGKGGSRNAMDRLLKHETLQRIALNAVPEGHRITLFLLEIQPCTQLITSINPFAKSTETGSVRIEHGLNKLFNTSEEERISLYEAALIRYLYPDFNKEFKESFPSTNLKILQDCYSKDFAAVIAEICFDDLPFELWSSSVPPKPYHIATHNLHKSEDRRMFFGM